ncbi:MAG: RNA methyltransferase [Candidatus Promineofilum sp.]|nr:RNA methyltransferase [Promineifilum sp.]
MITITSPQNPRIKRISKLNDRRARDEAGQTVVEGVREISVALGRGVVPVEVYLCPELIDGPEAETAARHLRAIAATGMTELFIVTPEVFAKMAYRGQSGGLLIVIAYRSLALDELQFRRAPFLVVIEEAEKPGNLGAVLRTADAAGVDAVIAPSPADGRGTDLHNPNVIRASLGAYFTVPTVATSNEQAIAWLRERGIAIVAATPAAEALYTETDLTDPLAVVVGSEAWGLSEAWLAAADRRVRIPMAGSVDSLNLSASAALMMYEVVRQRMRPSGG